MSNGIKFNIKSPSDRLNYPDPDFLPFACYFDKTTILTKNGELLKTIKIPNYIENTTKIDLFDVREKLRNIIYRSPKRDNISFWFHTVRRGIDLVSKKEYDNIFSKNLANLYCKQNEWENQYINEIYITIVISQDYKSFLNPLRFLSSISYVALKGEKLKQIQNLSTELEALTATIFESLEEYGIKLLSIKKNAKNIYYSEHLKFFSLICNLEEKDFKIVPNNLSEILIDKKVAYGNNIIEFNKENKKQFCAILSIKSYSELGLVQLDKLLQVSQDFIITEFSGYYSNKVAVNRYKKQKRMLELSEDVDFGYISGLDDFLDSNKDRNTDYSIRQTTIMLVADTKIELEEDLKAIHKVLNKLGIIAVREDLFMPTLFWSQVPANFSFLKRFDFVPSYNIGNFASLYNFPIGKLNRNYWGDSLTIFKTALKTPFFYNFHDGKNGNTFIVGQKGSGKTTMMNFLISEANKLCKRLFYIDCNRKSEVFVNALDGKYYGLIRKEEQKRKKFFLNPISLLKDKKNKEFLVDWLTMIVSYKKESEIDNLFAEELNKIPDILENVFKRNDKIKNLTDLAEFFNTPKTPTLYQNLQIWKDKGKLAFAFDNEKEDEFNSEKIGFDLSVFAKNKMVLASVAYYLLYKISQWDNNGEPTIVAIDDAWTVFDNFVLGSKFKTMMQELSEKNIAVVITTGGSYNVENSFIKEPVNDVFGSEIFLANKKTTDYQNVIFSIEEEESKMLNLMKERSRSFLVKSVDSIVIASNNLGFLKEKLLVLNNNNVSINAMKKAMDLTESNECEVWLPVFYKILSQYEKQVKEKKIKEQEERQLKWEQEHSGINTQAQIIKESK